MGLNSRGKSLIVNIILLLIYFVVEIGMCSLFGNECYGQHRLQKWVIDGS
jgi:hypothetical protein